MVAPVVVAGAAAVGTVAYGLYKAGKSSGKKKGRQEKEEEFTEEVKNDMKEEYAEEAKEEHQREKSRKAHHEATNRTPPVHLSETVRVAVEELEVHHSGTNRAMCRKEGFVIFVKDCPNQLSEGDVIDAKITSYNRGKTSADATFVSRVN